MAKYVLNLIQACNGAILKVTDGLPDNDHYCIIKEGDPETSGEDSPFVSLVGRYFNDFIIEEAWMMVMVLMMPCESLRSR